MTNRITIDDITESIHSQFDKGPPNGWLLGWDESRCFALISAAAAPHPTSNHTSFDYGFCNWFEVRIDSEGDDRYWTLTIKLSFIAPAYCIHWTQYESPTQGAVIPAAPVGYKIVEDKVRIAAENAGFFGIPTEWCEKQLLGVELELSGTENVTLGKCLFTDYAE